MYCSISFTVHFCIFSVGRKKYRDGNHPLGYELPSTLFLRWGIFIYMKYKNWGNFKLPCASISAIMTRPKNSNDLSKRDRSALQKIQSKEELLEADILKLKELDAKRERFLNPPLSETCKKYLVGMFGYMKYNAKIAKTAQSQKPCVTKGVELEEQGIELVSFIDKKQYQRPTGYVENENFIGVCDAICLEENHILYVKTSWNASNFMAVRISNKLSHSHWAQMQGYLDLYKLNNGTVCFVLANTPTHLIEQEKASFFKKYMFGEIDREKYEVELMKFDSLFNFEKIPINKRIIRFEVKKSEEYIQKVLQRLELSRNYLSEFDRIFMKNKNILTLPEDYMNVSQSEDEEDNT